MIEVLEKWGYYIGNRNGKINLKSNIVDAVLFTLYFFISLINSLITNASIVIFILNTISLGRLIIKNYIEQCQIVAKFPVENDGKYIPANITKIHCVKIVFESATLVLLIIFTIINLNFGNAYVAIKLMVILGLLLTLIENFLSMFERLYDAKPMPLVSLSNNINKKEG